MKVMDFRSWLYTEGTDRSLRFGVGNVCESIASSVALLLMFVVQYACLSLGYHYVQVGA